MDDFLRAEGAIYMEHFLVNEFFVRQMPFGDVSSLKESLLYFCTSYSLLKSILFAQAKKEGGMNKAIFIDTLYHYAKNYLHTPKFWEIVRICADALEVNSLAGMYLMVHD